MTDDEPIDLERERRIRRKIRGLGEAIEAAGDRSEFENNPTDYLEQKTMTEESNAYTVTEVAEKLSVTTDTVRRWCRDGELEAAKLGSAGYRISRRALAEFWRGRGGGELFPPARPQPMSPDDWSAWRDLAGKCAAAAIADGREPLEPSDDDLAAFADLLGREPTETQRLTFVAAFDAAIREHGGDND